MFILFDFWTEIWGVLRKVFLLLDSIGLTFIDDAYDLIISSVTAFNDTEVAQLANEISKNCYIIIGIFALFRIALMLINSIINPDKLTDKQEGYGNMIARLIITITLFVAVPIIFDKSRELQDVIINNNYISKLLIGKELIDSEETTDNEEESDENSDEQKNSKGNPGQQIKNIAVRTLIYPDHRLAESNGNEYVVIENSACDGDNACKAAIDAWNADVSYDTINMFIDSYVEDEDEMIMVYHYTPFVTLIVGIFITYVLFSFAIDIALRSVELVVLEILSPLFIVTYIDPKQGSKGTFSRWLSACGKTYLNLFIRIAIICLMLLLISKMNDLFSIATGSKGLLQLLMIIAILIFAKKAPKWLGDILGIDGSSLGGLGIGKKLAGAALVGGAIGKGFDSAKKWGTNKAKRVGSGIYNRLGANVGGAIGGISAARQNALGDTSVRSKREQVLKETGSKFKANKAAMKSLFNKDDRAERKKALADVDYKSASKEAIMNARVNATTAAQSGKFLSAVALGQGIKKQYDSGYLTHDEKQRTAAEAKFYANQGGFNMAEINRQKKIRADLDESSRILGRQTFANEKGDIYLDPAHTQPAIYNEKTIKKFAGEHVTTFADLGACQLTLGEQNVVLAAQDKKITVGYAGDGSAITAEVKQGTILRETADKDGKPMYEVLMSNSDVTSSDGEVISNNNTKLSSGGEIRATADGYEVYDKDGKRVSVVTRKSGDEVIVKDEHGQIVKEGKISEAMEEFAYKNVGGKESTTAKHLDAAFTSIIEGNASKFVAYEQKISESNNNIVELQTKKAQQINLQQSKLNDTEYGTMLNKEKQIKNQLEGVEEQLDVIKKILATPRKKGSSTVIYNGQVYDLSTVHNKQTELNMMQQQFENSIASLEAWKSSAVGDSARKEYENVNNEIKDSIAAIEEQIKGEQSYITNVEVEKRKICKDVLPVMFDGKEITTANYESLRTEISKKKESKEKIAKGSVGTPSTSGDKKE